MNKEINKIINWIEMGYTRLNYKEELSLVDYIKQLQQENKQLKEHIEKYEHYCKTTGIEELMKENKNYKEVIHKAIEYIEKCLKQTPTENRTKTDDTLDIEYEYILKILKEVE